MHAVYHLCGEDVLEDERYKEFMNGFSDETHVSRYRRSMRIPLTHTPSTSYRQSNIHQTRWRLHVLRSFRQSCTSSTRTYFHSPSTTFRHSVISVVSQFPCSLCVHIHCIVAIAGLPPKAILSQPDVFLSVRPVRPPTQDEHAKEDEFNPLVAAGSLPELSSSVKESFGAVKTRVSERAGRGSPASQPGDDVVITPLGTGSAIPTRMRNGTTCSITQNMAFIDPHLASVRHPHTDPSSWHHIAGLRRKHMGPACTHFRGRSRPPRGCVASPA